MAKFVGKNNKIGDIVDPMTSSDLPLRESWNTKDNNNCSSSSVAAPHPHSNGSSRSTGTGAKGTVVEEDEDVTQLLLSPSSVDDNSPTSPPIKTKKQAQIVESKNVHLDAPPKGKKKRVNHAGGAAGGDKNYDSTRKAPSAVVIDVESNNNNTNGNGNGGTLETVHSPGSLAYFKSFITNTLTVTSVDSKFRQRFSGKFGRIRKRIVYKNGTCNLLQTNISKRRRRYLADIFTTLVDIKWRFTLLIFAMSFILSWLLFAMIWWIIAFRHGDLEEDHLPGNQEASQWKPCVASFHGFTSAFLFSIETQHTIGYGSRFTTEECPDAIFVMSFQSIMGVMIQALTVGIVFAKLSRPKKRTQTLVFSRHGVVCERDGILCLMFRVGDMRKSHFISATVRAHLIKRRVTKEGEVLPYYQYDLNVAVDDDQTQVFFIWPMIVVHKITKDSPLYNVTATDLANENFEIVLVLQGVVETTGATTEARTSYLPSEILWGQRFESMVSFRKDVLQYSINYTLFNSSYEIETPICSAKELDEVRNIQLETKKEGKPLLTPFRVGPATRRFSCTPVLSPLAAIPPFEKKEI